MEDHGAVNGVEENVDEVAAEEYASEEAVEDHAVEDSHDEHISDAPTVKHVTRNAAEKTVTHAENKPTIDSQFAKIQPNHTSFIIWRVENLELVEIPRAQYGKFHSGDSYLIYCAFQAGQPSGMELKPTECRGPLQKFIHFWLGSETSLDEAGVVAIKAVELDTVLGGSPVQQREVEGSESSRFMSYFKEGIRLLPGGAASGFHHVTDQFNPVLYSVKGKKQPVIRHLPQISWSLMNEGDVFVLDNKDFIFIWIGKLANNFEKMQAAKLAQTLKSDHGQTNITIVIIEDGKELTLPQNERKVFDSLLPIHEKKLQSIETAETDEKSVSSVASVIKLYRCSDEGGTLKVVEVKKGPLHQTDLDSKDSFIVDHGHNGVYVWIGKHASQTERAEAMRNGQGFAKKKEYPPNTKVLRVIDGGEPPEFKSLFLGWKERDQTIGMGKQYTIGKIAKVAEVKFDVTTLHERPQLASETGMVDDGSGKKDVYRIIDFELSLVSPSEHGKFYGGDCYVINYSYMVGGSERNIIYYWLGATSGQDERGTAALKAVELDNSLGGRAVQVRVVHGKEPKHFLAMFSGTMIIYAGGIASSFEQKEGEESVTLARTHLLQVRGNSAYEHDTRAIEVPLKASSLNSNDVFVLNSPKGIYIWCGKGSTGDERETAKKLAAKDADYTVVPEGKEKADFWELLGGKEEYWSDKRTAEEFYKHPPRLFQCSNASGNFKVNEIVDFSQSDLVEDDVMVLDAWDSIYIWIGATSNKNEINTAEKIIIDYLKGDPKDRDADLPVMKIRQGCEPPTFTGFFGAWDPTIWENGMNFEKMKEDLRRENPNMTIAVTAYDGDKSVPNHYPLDVLQEKDPERLPKDVDFLNRELSLQNFDEHFKMSRESYLQLPKWKRDNLKKTLGLF